MRRRSVSDLVEIYRRQNAPQIDGYLRYFRELNSVEKAICDACHGRKGTIHPHQHLVGKVRLEAAKVLLLAKSRELTDASSFEEILAIVEAARRQIHGFGELAVYDTSLRISAFLEKLPMVVYLHAGTKVGCRALGVSTRGGKVEMSRLPPAIQTLMPYQAEDFLCIYKEELAESVTSNEQANGEEHSDATGRRSCSEEQLDHCENQASLLSPKPKLISINTPKFNQRF
jgi:hypothetical protein